MFELLTYYRHLHDDKLPPGITPKHAKYLQVWALITPQASKIQVDYTRLPQTFDAWCEFSLKPVESFDGSKPRQQIPIFDERENDFEWTYPFINGCFLIIFGHELYEENDDIEQRIMKIQMFCSKIFSIYNKCITAMNDWWKVFVKWLHIRYPAIDGQVRIHSYSTAMENVKHSISQDYTENVDYWKSKLQCLICPPLNIKLAKALSYQLNLKNEEYISFVGIHFVIMIIDKRLEEAIESPSHTGV